MILIVNLLAYIKCIVLYLYLHFKNAIIRVQKRQLINHQTDYYVGNDALY